MTFLKYNLKNKTIFFKNKYSTKISKKPARIINYIIGNSIIDNNHSTFSNITKLEFIKLINFKNLTLINLNKKIII